MFCKIDVNASLVNPELLFLEGMQGWKEQFSLVTHKK